MRIKCGKPLSIVIAAALALSLFAAAPIAASAYGAVTLANQINEFNHAGIGTITAVASGNEVTVTGSAVNVWHTLQLEIDSGVTVIWKAAYSASELSQNPTVGEVIPHELIRLLGSGTFEVAAGGSVINRNKGDAIVIESGVITVDVSGGTVGAIGEYNAISVNTYSGNVTVSGGTVESSGNAAIYAPMSGARINVRAGMVSYTGARGFGILSEASSSIVVSGGNVVHAGEVGQAICAMGGNTYLEISGGLIFTDGSPGKAAINVSGTGSSVKMSGGIVGGSSAPDEIGLLLGGYKSGFIMTGGQVSSTRGRALYVPGSDCSVSIGGTGSLYTLIGMAISADDGGNVSIMVSGDATVTAEDGYAIYAACPNPSIRINGGKVCATNGNAIYTKETNARVLLESGFVFAYGDGIMGQYNVIRMLGGEPVIDGYPVVCAWDASKKVYSYVMNSTDDLTKIPAGASVKWDRDGDQSGIRYENGAVNKGFFPIGIMVADIANFIAAPSNLTATAGAGGIALVWTDNSNTEAEFVIARVKGVGESTPYATVPANTTSYTDTGVEAGSTYSYYVYGKNGSWLSQASNRATATAVAMDAGSTAAPGDGGGGSGSSTLSGNLENFKKIKVYNPGQFSDVDENEWYGLNQRGSVSLAYEYGLMQGVGAGEFNPDGDISVAEAITVAARVHSIFTTGAEKFDDAGGKWYQTYVDYAAKNGIIGGADDANLDGFKVGKDTEAEVYNRAATRAEMAAIFSRSLPASELASQNTVNSLPDVNANTPYNGLIAALYKAGVVAGNDAAGAFYPDNNITRAEAAAIISRIILPSMRIRGNTYG